MAGPSPNIDLATVAGFGNEWAAFDQTSLPKEELERIFDQYFHVFPLETLSDGEGFDLGCGSGRWAQLVAPKVRKLHCIDPSAKALKVSRERLSGQSNVEFHLAGSHDIPLAENSQDFGYSVGVLHHIPDTEQAMARCVAKLRPGAPFLVYLYYRFDQRPRWFRLLWRVSDLGRKIVSRTPFGFRRAVAESIAMTVYWPLARGARVAERLGANVSNWPLTNYRNLSFYTMRTDALDRFGTRLEHRFLREEIAAMMRNCGLEDICFSEGPPYWVAVGRKAAQGTVRTAPARAR